MIINVALPLQKAHQERVTRKEATIISFRWNIQQFKELIVQHRGAAVYKPLSSSIFAAAGGPRFRGIIQFKKDYGIYLQLVAAVNPVMSEIR